jgi:putative PEP-CTERM system histidine kinase
VVHNAEKHKRNPEFVDDAIATIANSVDRMSRLLVQLTQGQAAEQRRSVDLADLLARVVQRAANRLPHPTLKVISDCSTEADPDRLIMVLDHVIRNAQDATGENGEVEIELDCEAQAPRIHVRDNGIGMDETFQRDRLFRPFDTTKGSKGMGIGAYQAREYLRSLGGEVSVSSAPGQGTTFGFLFAPPRAAAPRTPGK